jgi:hypothetical protein
MPALEAVDVDRLSPWTVNRIIGVFGKTLRSSDAAVKPFMTGIERSKVITSGLICPATSIASLPFSASAHVLKPSDKKAAASNFRIVALSSTTKTVLPAPRFLGSLSISTDPRFRRTGVGYNRWRFVIAVKSAVFHPANAVKTALISSRDNRAYRA